MDETFFIRTARASGSGRAATVSSPSCRRSRRSSSPSRADFEGVDPHTHPDHADSFYVLEGEVEFFLDDAWHRVGPGTFLSVPPNVEHGFRPCGVAFRLLNFHTPNVGFIEWLREG